MTTCRTVGDNQPRLLRTHLDTCDNATCHGCQPCEAPHCRICGQTHVDHTCPDCLHGVRTNLTEIGHLIANLPDEAEVQGIDSEAMNLLGPTDDPEQRGHIEASIAAGRIDPNDYETSTKVDLLHPRHVIGCWDMLIRDALEHSEPDAWEIPDGIAYLDTQLTYLAGYPHLPFEDLANDLKLCRRHLERVLHDGQQRDTGAPCLDCRIPLVREWGTLAAADGWRCPRCNEWRTEDEYRLNVAQVHRDNAEWLTDQEMELRTGHKASKIRKWAERGDVQKRRDSGRTVYSVTDVLARGVLAS